MTTLAEVQTAARHIHPSSQLRPLAVSVGMQACRCWFQSFQKHRWNPGSYLVQVQGAMAALALAEPIPVILARAPPLTSQWDPTRGSPPAIPAAACPIG